MHQSRQNFANGSKLSKWSQTVKMVSNDQKWAKTVLINQNCLKGSHTPVQKKIIAQGCYPNTKFTCKIKCPLTEKNLAFGYQISLDLFAHGATSRVMDAFTVRYGVCHFQKGFITVINGFLLIGLRSNLWTGHLTYLGPKKGQKRAKTGIFMI